MALLNVGEVVQAIATLHDDPSQSEIDRDYVIPFLNLRWSNLVRKLTMLGLQNSEASVILTIPAGTKDFTSLMVAGQPLASMLQPKSIDWKLVGNDDTEYQPSDGMNELDDQPQGSTGILQFSYQGGTVLVTPSAVDVVARIRFDALDATLVDNENTLIRGAGDILAFRTAELMLGVRGGSMGLDLKMKAWGDEAIEDFLALSTMRAQTNFYQIPPTHKRRTTTFGITLLR